MILHCITLEKHKRLDDERLADFTSQGFTLKPFFGHDATDGSFEGSVKFDQADFKATTPTGREAAAGEFGCYVSHIEALRAFVAEDLEPIDPEFPDVLGIIEDDIFPRSTFTADAMREKLREMDSLGMFYPYHPPKQEDATGEGITRTRGEMIGTWIYFVHRIAARQLLTWLSPRMKTPIDLAFQVYHRFGPRPCFQLKPAAITHEGYGTSLIQPERIDRRDDALGEKSSGMALVIGPEPRSLNRVTRELSRIRGVRAKYASLGPSVPWIAGGDNVSTVKARYLANRLTKGLKGGKLSVEAAHYWLNHLDAVRALLPDIKIVCITGSPRALVESILETSDGFDHWTKGEGKPSPWDRTFPNCPPRMTKRERVKRYVLDYLAKIEELSEYESVFVIKRPELGNADRVSDLHKFLEI